MDSYLLPTREQQQDFKMFVHSLMDHHFPFVFLSQSSSHSRKQVMQRFVKLGIVEVEMAQVYTAIMATIDTLAKEETAGQEMYYLGNDAIKEALQQGGFTVGEFRPKYVLIGNSRSATMEDYSYACQLIKDGATGIMISNEPSMMKEGTFRIGNGAIADMVESATNTKVLRYGFPSPVLVSCACNYLEVAPTDAVLITQDAKRGVVAGNAAGVETVLLTKDIGDLQAQMKSDIAPTYVAQDFLGLLR